MLLWPHFVEKSVLMVWFVHAQGIYKIGNFSGYILHLDAISASLDLQLMKRVRAQCQNLNLRVIPGASRSLLSTVLFS